MKNDDKKQTVGTGETSGTTPDVVNNLEITCQEYANEYIQSLDDPNEIYNNNGLFVGMLKYIYRFYLKHILDNATNRCANRYDFKLLDKLFYIYTDMVYRYKQNKRASILEFCIFTNINRSTLYNAVHGLSKKLTPEDTDTVQNWFTECENTLTNGSSVFEIFLLKSQYRYNDNLSPIPIESQVSPLSVADLPDLGPQKTAIIDKNDPEREKT